MTAPLGFAAPHVSHKYCRAGEDWREFSKTRLLPPTKAGALMSVLNGQYLLRQLYCPSCAVLLGYRLHRGEYPMTQEGPNRPEPQPLKLDGKTSAIVVLDLSVRCEDPQEVCSKLMQPLGELSRTGATGLGADSVHHLRDG